MTSDTLTCLVGILLTAIHCLILVTYQTFYTLTLVNDNFRHYIYYIIIKKFNRYSKHKKRQ